MAVVMMVIMVIVCSFCLGFNKILGFAKIFNEI